MEDQAKARELVEKGMEGSPAPEGAPSPEEFVELLYSPDMEAKFAPLRTVMEQNGWTAPVEHIFIVAQMDARTQGKSPEELAKILESDPTIYEDLEAQASGKMDQMKAEMGVKPGAKKEEAPLPDVPMPPEEEAKLNFDQKAAMMEKKAKKAEVAPPPGDGGM